MNKEIICNGLDFYFSNPKSDLKFTKDYEFLLSVMLSAQTTDKRVNIVTENLYKKYDSLEKLNSLSIKELEEILRPLGFHKNKSFNFKEIVNKLQEKGHVPNDRAYLESLPGVGRKTANVVLADLFNEPCIAVDTHVERVSKRLNIAKEKDSVIEVEKKLMKFFDKSRWSKVNSQIVLFGRYHCTAKKPKCKNCKLFDACRYKFKDKL